MLWLLPQITFVGETQRGRDQWRTDHSAHIPAHRMFIRTKSVLLALEEMNCKTSQNSILSVKGGIPLMRQKKYVKKGLYGLKYQIVEISGDATDVGRTDGQQQGKIELLSF